MINPLTWALDKTFNLLEDALVFEIDDIAPYEEYTNAEQLNKSTEPLK